MPMSFLQFSDKVLRSPVTIMDVCHVHPAELSLEDFVLKESTRAAQNHTTAGTQEEVYSKNSELVFFYENWTKIFQTKIMTQTT